jgi:Flp pilus assembly protein TadD
MNKDIASRRPSAQQGLERGKLRLRDGRSGLVAGAATLVFLLVVADEFLRQPAMATPGLRTRASGATEMKAATPVSRRPVPAMLSSPPSAQTQPAERAGLGGSVTSASSDPDPALSSRAGAGPGAAHLRLAGRLIREGLFREALHSFREACRLAPDEPEAHFGVALASTELGLERQARLAVARALELDPNHPLANLLAAHLFQSNGDPTGAREYYEQYLRLEPQGPFASKVREILAAPGWPEPAR